MNDYLILNLYVIALTLNFTYVVVLDIKRSADSLLALLLWYTVLYTVNITEAKYPIDDVFMFAIYGTAYLIFTVYLWRKGRLAWVGGAVVASYYLYFSFDSWINWDVETWAYTNHESIVFTAHLIVMLLLIKVRAAMVLTRVNLFWRNRCSAKDNECN